MNVRIGLVRFVQDLSSDRSERRCLASAVVALLRQRRWSLFFLVILLRLVPHGSNTKLQLWKSLVRSHTNSRSQWNDCELSTALVSSLRSTSAYTKAVEALERDRNGFVQRGRNYCNLRQHLSESPPERLLVFHHYDRRGLLPFSWLDALMAIQAAGWQVVVSTSCIDRSASSALLQAGVLIARRSNIGLCLGAYRDLALLIHSIPSVHRHLKSLVLLNDSNLLLQSPEVLLVHLDKLSAQSSCKLSHEPHKPILSGFTDSFERQLYHLQSYFLHANQALLQHQSWLKFWLDLRIDGSKDDLINKGEIGLSQMLLASGVVLNPAYPLVQRLLSDRVMADELQAYNISQPEQVNQSLFSWSSLLDIGFPFVKKHVLFRLVEHQGQRMAISELARRIPEERRELIARDIQELLISHYSR